MLNFIFKNFLQSTHVAIVMAYTYEYILDRTLANFINNIGITEKEI